MKRPNPRRDKVAAEKKHVEAKPGTGNGKTKRGIPDRPLSKPVDGKAHWRAARENRKAEELALFRDEGAGPILTTNQGVALENDQDTLKAGERGPSLLEDFHFREKITHFDHERIPERIVHARGSGAHGYFQVYEDLSPITKAHFLRDPSLRTPVFTRFSTVVGSRGSSDMPRDARGFAVKFYTQEGNFDLVGNNIPVFFIQDAIKFPDLVHAIKPEPDSEMPQASSAHDTFWDFISLMPESMHMILWLMSDRAIPRSFRMMEGFGVHTFRLINAAGESRFVKFHWKPLLGVHSVVWDEAQKISGKDPDFHRRDLWEAIESGHPARYELGLQIVEEEDEHAFGFDLLDPTKIIPEELVPVRRVGRLTLDRNPDNFFAEVEQVAFHPGNLVPGIDFSDDPLLQGRLFSYTDTQLLRLGGPNFHEIPINRSVAPVFNNQRDGFMRQEINRGKTAYEPNSISRGCPFETRVADGGFMSYPARIAAGPKVRSRPRQFFDHFSQATLFFRSQSLPERDHLIEALRFELGKIQRLDIRERMIGLLGHVDSTLASRVAEGLGIPAIPRLEPPINHSIGADADVEDRQPIQVKPRIARSEALSMANTVKDTIETRRVAILAAAGVDGPVVLRMKNALAEGGAQGRIVAPHLGFLPASDGHEFLIDFSFLTTSSVLFDAVYVPGGRPSILALAEERDAIEFLMEAYRHCKTIGASGEGADLLRLCPGFENFGDGGELPTGVAIIANDGTDGTLHEFLSMIAQHRHWARAGKNRTVPDRTHHDEPRGGKVPR